MHIFRPLLPRDNRVISTVPRMQSNLDKSARQKMRYVPSELAGSLSLSLTHTHTQRNTCVTVDRTCHTQTHALPPLSLAHTHTQTRTNTSVTGHLRICLSLSLSLSLSHTHTHTRITAFLRPCASGDSRAITALRGDTSSTRETARPSCLVSALYRERIHIICI